MAERWQQGAEDPTDYGGWAGMSIRTGSVMLPACLSRDEPARVPIYCHWLMIVLPALTIIGALSTSTGPSGFILAIIVSLPGLYFTVYVHEIGHLVVAARAGATPVKIVLWPLGGLTVIANLTPDYCTRIRVSAAGPLTHIPMGLFWFFLFLASISGKDSLYYGDSGDPQGVYWFAVLFANMFWINVLMFIFNGLVPCFPLDCSAIVMNTMAWLGYQHTSIAWCMVYTSVPIIFLIAIWGLWAFITTGFGSFQIFTAAWLGYQTYVLYKAVKGDSLASNSLFKAMPAVKAEPASTSYKAPVAPFEYMGPQVCLSAAIALHLVLKHVALLEDDHQKPLSLALLNT